VAPDQQRRPLGLTEGTVIDASAHTVSAGGIRRIVLEQSKRADVGHIGSCLSVADVVAALYGGVLDVDDPGDADRDRFILSKGHAALALYAALHLRGWLSAEELDTFCADGSRLGVHPEHFVRGVDFSTGSLGHGLAIGVGAALAARAQGSARRVYVLMSDAECNEGSVWEAAMFAAHHKLANLVAIVDDDGQQALGHTRDIIDMSPMADRWRAFGWEAWVVDGNDADAVAAALSRPDRTGQPRVVVAETVFGKGVSFMEGQIRWHYMPMSDAEFCQAREEVNRAPCVAPSSEP